MKQPKLSDLKIDKKATQRLRSQMVQAKKIKITINVDADILSNLKKIAAKNGAPYQTLLNRLLREVISKKSDEESRLAQLEKEISAIKKRLAA